MSRKLIDDIRGLDDLRAVMLIRHVAPILFNDARVRNLVAAFPPPKSGPAGELASWEPASAMSRLLTSLGTLPLHERQEMLSGEHSVWIARALLAALASDDRFVKVLNQALKTLRRDELVMEGRIPRGLATDIVRVLASARQTDTATGPELDSPNPLVDLALVALGWDERRISSASPTDGVRVEEERRPLDRERQRNELESLLDGGLGLPDRERMERVRVEKERRRLDRLREDERHGNELVRREAELPRMDEPRMDVPRDPPRSSYGYIECADSVIANEVFEVVIGLSEMRAAGVAGEAIVRPASSIGPYSIDMHVIADGFRTNDDESLFHTLLVTAELPYPKFKFHLRAAPPASEAVERQIRVRYVINDQVVGMASRPVIVKRSEETPHPKILGKRYRNFAIPTGPVPPDLTIYILKMEEGNRIGWSFHSPHAGIDEPPEPITVPMEKAEEFARMLIDEMRVEEGKATLFRNMRGQGKRITAKIPEEVLEAIQATAKKTAPEPPVIFLITDEPYVPWELAVIKPFFDEVPPFLAAQATVGRWILTSLDLGTPPPIDIRVAQMAVIAGDYKTPNFRKLPSAVDEAQDLRNAYAAVPIDATTEKVLLCIQGTPHAEVLHFAVHGVYDTNTTLRGLIMVDGTPITPPTILGSDLTSTHPFVFLNACQLGTGESVLGDYAGMAEAFVGAGAAGVIAPLWSVKDAIAREIAVNFYREAFQSKRTAAEILRDERRKFGTSVEGAPPSSTYLAYQFFGHPQLFLQRGHPQP
jgi:CHAT domain-containing protein